MIRRIVSVALLLAWLGLTLGACSWRCAAKPGLGVDPKGGVRVHGIELRCTKHF